MNIKYKKLQLKKKKVVVHRDEIRTKKNKEALLEAMTKHRGLITQACKEADLARTTFYTYYKEDVDFKAKVDDMDELVLDFAEGKLFENIDDGDTTAQIFLLKCKGKRRGYIEKSIIGISKEKENLLSDEEMASVADNLDGS